MNVIFFGTPAYVAPLLHALLALGHSVEGVFAPPDRPAGRGRGLEPPGIKTIALGLGLPVFQPLSLRAAEALELVASLRPHLVLVAAYGKILPPQILSLPRHGCLSLHPSLLPRYRGPSPVVSAILEGAATTGVTLMVMDPGIDTGPIVAQREEAISPRDTAQSLTQRLFLTGAALIREALPLWVEGEITARPQDSTLATYTRKVSKEDGWLDWSLPAGALERRVRAYTPWPTCAILWKGKLLKVLEARSLAGDARAPVGTVVPLSEPFSAGVVTGQGILVLERLQLEGRKAVSVPEFLRGYPDLLGSLLPS